MNLFYAVWSDAINYERIKNDGEGHWKSFTFSYMSVFTSFNIMSLYSAILFFTGYNFAQKSSQLLSAYFNELLSDALWAIVVLFIPSMLINYFFVFYKRKYEYILSNYKFRNGRLLMSYILLTVFFMFGFGLLNTPVSADL